MRALKTAVLSIGLLALGAGAFAQGAPAQASTWRAGVHYKVLENPQAPTAPAGKVQVTEAFWYGCGHCFALDPVLEEWSKTKAPYIEFTRVPVIWGPMHLQHAKLFYTVQALRRPELHAKVFDAIHKDQQPLADQDEVKAREMHFAFLSAHGVTREQFNASYDSMTVTTNLRRAAAFTNDYQVGNVPAVFVAGKYATGVSEAGGPRQLLMLIDHLAASEHKR